MLQQVCSLSLRHSGLVRFMKCGFKVLNLQNMDIKTPKVEEVKDAQSWQRISTHSHVRGLGLDDTLDPRTVSEGLVG